MTILFLANGYSIHSYKWINYFSDKYNIVWLSVDGFDESFTKDKTIKYIDCKLSKIKLINIIFGIIKVIYLSKKISIDLFHVHYLGYHTFLCTFTRKIPLVLTAWGSDIVFGFHSFLRMKFLKHYLNVASIVTCDSHHMREKINTLINNGGEALIINFGINNNDIKVCLYAPGKEYVAIKGNWNSQSPNGELMKLSSNGFWWYETILEDGNYHYQFNIDGEKLIADPWSKDVDWKDIIGVSESGDYRQARTVFNIGEQNYTWNDESFDRPSINELIIYELHVGDFGANSTEYGIFNNVVSKIESGYFNFRVC